MNTEQIGFQVFETISPIVPVAISWLSVRAAQLIKTRVKNEYLAGMLARLDDAVTHAVGEVDQTVVQSLKAASSTGTLTAEDANTARNAALASVKSHLGPKGVAELIKVLGIEPSELEKVLTTRIEAAVNDLNTAKSTPPPAGTAGDAQGLAA